MAGTGLKRGYIHGQSDELGFDHEQLTYRFQGRLQSPPVKRKSLGVCRS
jgi:hypothetical protein